MRTSPLSVRTVVSAAVLAAVTGTLFAAAVQAKGYHDTAMDLNDASVWVTKQGEDSIGRLNTQIDIIDTRLAVGGSRFDVLQSGSTVLVDEQDLNTLISVDVRLGTFTAKAALPPGAKVYLGGQTAAVLDPPKGQLWVAPAAAIAGENFADTPPTATVDQATVAAVGVDGTVHVFDPSKGVLTRYAATGQILGRDHLSPVAQGAQVSAVGPTPVVLDPAGTLLAPGHSAINLSSIGANPILQQPGPARSSLLVASDSGLVDVPLNGGPTHTLFDHGTGSAIPPVWLAGCAYSAWEQQPTYATACTGSASRSSGFPNLPADAVLRFRINHNRVVLNELVSGATVVFTGGDAARVDDWTQAQVATQDNANQPTGQGQITTPSAQKPSRHPGGVNHPPVAVDDHAATRVGRPVVAHPLTHDTDPDGDVLAIASLSPPGPGQGSAAIVEHGQAVQYTPPPGQTGNFSFGYTITDGWGGSASASILVAVKSLDNADPPVTTPAHAVVEAGKQVTVDVLTGDSDPQGDALILTGAAAPSGVVQFEPNGEVAFTAPADPGTVTVTYTVVDEVNAKAAGQLIVTVLAAGTLVPPVARDSYAQTFVGEPVTVNVLANDTSPNDAPLTLVRMDSVSDATVTWQPSGDVRFVSATAKSFPVTYDVSDGTQIATGVLRIDVLPAPQSSGKDAPIAVRDDVVVRLGTPTVVDVTANDIDPTGGVLVVQGVTLPASSGLVVQVVDHHLLRVTETMQQQAAVAFEYLVTNGHGQADGVVVVRAAPPGYISQAPVTQPTVVSIRAGNVTSIDVLSVDSSPNGDPLTLANVAALPPGDGTLFVESNQLRYQAPVTPLGGVRTTYTVRDTEGNEANGAVLIHVLPVNAPNNPPAPRPLLARTFTGRQVTISVPLVGMDPDGDPVTLLGLVQPPQFGQVTVQGGDAFVYQSATGATGTDRFTYRVQDSLGAQALGTVMVGVAALPAASAPPVAVPVTAQVRPGGTVRIDALASDSDPQDLPISYQSGPGAVGTPRVGTATIQDDAIVYKASAGAAPGQVSFDYGIADTLGGTARGLVTVTVSTTITPQHPIARDDVITPQKAGAAVSVNVLTNDSNPDGATADLKVTVDGFPAATVNGGTVTFTMPSTSVAFVYTDTNPEGLTADALVQVPLAVNLPPVANHDDASTNVNTPVTVDVLANDIDPEGRALRLASVVNQQDGIAALSGNKVVFTPAQDFVGQGGFSYEVTDGAATAVGTATVTVTGVVNIPVVTTAVSLTVSAGGNPGTVDLHNAIVNPDASLTYTFSNLAGGLPGVTQTLSGSNLTVTADLSAHPASGRLTYQVSDGQPRGTATGTVALTVVATQKPPPQAINDTAQTNQGQPVSIPVTQNDFDPLGKGLTVSVGAVANGQAQVNGGTIMFTPDPSFVGVTSFGYTDTDGAGRTAQGTVTVTVIGRPSAPTAPTGTVHSHAVDLTWGIPSNNGAPIDHYTVQASNGPNQQCQSNTCTITGLTDGTAYTFTVAAHNAAGDGPASPPSPSYTPDALPDVPSAPTVQSADSLATVTWTAPNDTGTPISTYTLQVSPPPASGPSTEQIPGSTTTYSWQGLTNGTAYTFEVKATNGAGTTDYSPPSSPDTPAGPPLTPRPPTADQGNSQEVVHWAAPDDNGSSITSFEIVPTGNGQQLSPVEVSDPAQTSTTVTGLTNGTAYTFIIRAQNKAGWSPYSQPSAPVTAAGKPTRIGSVTATAGDQLVTLSFTPPDPNGDPITGYSVIINGGSPQQLASNDEVTGLTNGTAYTFKVYATNGVGDAPPSPPSNPATPHGAPGQPSVSGSANSQQITWNWTPASDTGGSPIDHYLVSVNGAGQSTYPANQTSFTATYGYSATETLSVIAVNATGDQSSPGTATVQTPAPPQPTITVAKGASADGFSGRSGSCSNPDCYWVNVTLANFTPNTRISLECNANGSGYWAFTMTTDGNGNAYLAGSPSGGCFYGYPGGDFDVSGGGVDSNHINPW